MPSQVSPSAHNERHKPPLLEEMELVSLHSKHASLLMSAKVTEE